MSAHRDRHWCRLVVCCAWLATTGLSAEEPPSPESPPTNSPPLHERIDALMEAAHIGPLPALVDDAEFARRLYLDLTGRVPTIDQLRSFLGDPAEDKRITLVDQLLSSTAHVRFLAYQLDLMLMERRGDQHVPAAEWQRYLYDRVAANTPFHKLAEELLAADGVDPAQRPAVKFYLDREGDSNLLTRDVGRIFFGMDLQCCQCHDHPLIGDYLQRDYYGIFAFLNRSFVFTDEKEKKSYFAEKAEGNVDYKSVFTEESVSTGPRLPGDAPIAEPVITEEEAYLVKPDKNVRPVPKYSRRAALAEQVALGTNRAFRRNAANRLWALVMGRGLVEPVDLHSDDNPAVHPVLLDMLADDLASTQFDIRAFLRQLVLTRTYQRRIDLPHGLADASTAAAEQLEGLRQQQQQLESQLAEVRESRSQAIAAFDTARQAQTESETALDAAQATRHTAQQALDAARQMQTAAEQQLAVRRDLATALQNALQASQVALEKLPEDEALKAATATYQAKAATVTAELATLQADLEQKVAAGTAAQQALQAAESALPPVVAQHQQSQQALQQAEARLAAADQQLGHRLRETALVEQRLQWAQRLIDYGSVAQQSRDTAQQLSALETERTTASETMAQWSTTAPQLQAEVTALEQSTTEMGTTVRTLEEQVKTGQQAAAAVAEAANQAEAVHQKVPDDPELAGAATQLKARSDALQQQLTQQQSALAQQQAALQQATAQLSASRQQLTAGNERQQQLQTRLAEIEPQLPALREQTGQLAEQHQKAQIELGEHWANRFAVSPLTPLTPEQLAWSILQITGQVDQTRAAVIAELDGKQPLSDEDKQNPAAVAERERLVEQTLAEKLQGNVNLFVNLFSIGSGQSQDGFFATVDQALFFANGGQIRSWLAPNGENLTGRLLKMDDAAQLAGELYLAVLSRPPDDEETQDVLGYLQTRADDKSAAVQDLAWALISSAEFRFNH